MKKLGKKILIILIVAVAVVVLGCVSIYSLTSQKDIRLVTDGSTLGRLPIVGPNALVELVPGLTMKLDTGCDFSIITQADLERIKRMGLKVDSTYYPQLGRDRAGHVSLRMRRYHVDVPMGEYIYGTDSAGNNIYEFSGKVNMIRHVDFVPAEPDETSLLGIDLLERFIVEYTANPETLTLCTELPDGYNYVDEIHEMKNLADVLTLGHRYYTRLKVERKSNNFFIDTGLRNIHIKLPSEARRRSKRTIVRDTMLQRNHRVPVYIDSSAWAEYGNRAGNYVAFYYDSRFGSEEYAVNPLILFQQDAVLDFPNRKLALRPFVTLPKRQYSL